MAADIKKNWFEKLTDDMKAKAKELSDSFKEYKTEFAETPHVSEATTEATLKDSTPFKHTGDKLEKGCIVTVVTESGEVPMPDGEYTLPDDSVMVVINDGTNAVVSEIKQAVAQSAETAMDKAVSERITKIVEKFEAVEKAWEAKFKLQNNIIEALKLKQGKLAKDLADTFSVVEAFGMIETDSAIEKPAGNGKSSAHDKKMNLIKTQN